MKVFRVQHKDTQEGPYGTVDYLHRKHGNGTHPSPHREGLDMSHTDYCGFENLKKLNAWFDERDKHHMHDAEFHIVQFSVPTRFRQLGRQQLIFERAEAHIVKTYSLKEI